MMTMITLDKIKRDIYEYLQKQNDSVQAKDIKLPYSCLTLVVTLSYLEYKGLVVCTTETDLNTGLSYEKWSIKKEMK